MMQQMSVIQQLLLLLFLNINLPRNLDKFLSIFKVGMMKFIPNPFAWFFESYEEDSVYSPPRFRKYGFDGLILKNCGQFFLLFSILAFIHLVTLALTKLVNIQSKILVKIREELGFQLIFKMLINTSFIFLISVLLQLQTMDFGSAFKVVSWSFGLIQALTFSILLGYIFYVYFRMKKSRKRKILKELLEKYAILFEGFIVSKYKPAKPFMAMIIFKRIVSVLFIVLAYNQPRVSTIVLLILAIVYTFVLLTTTPYVNRIEQIFQAIIEVLLIIVYLLMMIFPWAMSDLPEEHPSKIKLGWAVISLCITIIVVVQFRSLVSLYLILKGIFSKDKHKLTKYQQTKVVKLKMGIKQGKIKGSVGLPTQVKRREAFLNLRNNRYYEQH